MWSVLTIIILMSSMTNADVEVYDEKAEKILSLICPNPILTSAKLFNSDEGVSFRVRKPEENDGEFIILLPQSDQRPKLEDRSKVCGGFLGIQLNNIGPIICRISLFIIAGLYYHESDTYSMEFQAFFGLGTKAPVILNIPLFQIPFQLTSEDKKDELKSWANKHRVGLHIPVDSQTLNDIQNNQPVTLHFSWLNELLEFGIQNRRESSVEGEMNTGERSFVSRPIVLTKTIIDEVSEVIPFLNE